MLLVGGTSFAIYNQYESPGPLDAPRIVIIPKGEGRIAIAERLEKEGIITNRWTFVGGHLLQSFLGHKKGSELKAGEYQIKEHASMRDVIDTLSEGKSILYKTTLPEGLTSEQIVERLKAEPSLSGEITTRSRGRHASSRHVLFLQGRLAHKRSSTACRQGCKRPSATLWDGRDKRSADQVAAGTGDVRVDRRKGNRASR